MNSEMLGLVWGNLEHFMVFLGVLCMGVTLIFYFYQSFSADGFLAKKKLANYDDMKAKLERYEILIHDFYHYQRTISYLISEGKHEEINAMCQQMNVELHSVESSEYTNDEVINAILNEYENKCKQDGVEISINVEKGFYMSASSLEKARVLNNLLENGLRASRASQEKSMHVEMFMKNDGFLSVVKINNSFAGEIKVEKGRLKTTKRSGGIHGFGVRSVDAIANKNGGFLKQSWDEQMFKSLLVMSNC